jgi:hypothetical protein
MSSLSSKEKEAMPCNDGMFLSFIAFANIRNAVMEKANKYKFKQIIINLKTSKYFWALWSLDARCQNNKDEYEREIRQFFVVFLRKFL